MAHYAPNPLLGSNTFVPDVEAHVWADGRIYLYGSYDIPGRSAYCSDCYHVYSSDNMKDWKDHGVAFSFADSAWAKDKGALYAPDCAYKNGKYYLYYCVPDGSCGVAISDHPAGPFQDVGQIAHVQGIDPAVFIDDDGAAYLYWGQFDHVRVARLRENMIEIDPETILRPLSVQEYEFHEGSSVKKINGKYYYLFTDTHRHGGRATCLGYAISDHPMSGFRYGGVIIDNFGCDPKTWNNHGSLECFKGQWYVFYHRSTHGSENSRWVCAEKIHINPDGSIDEVRMSTSGAGAALPAGDRISADRACGLRGNARIAGDSAASQGMALREIFSGDAAIYRDIHFDGENAFSLHLKCDGQCRVELYIDEWYHACLTADASGEYALHRAKMPELQGDHALKLEFHGEFDRASLDFFQFTKEE